MFEELIKTLGRLDGRHEVSVSLPSDAYGYFDRECPASDCQCQFKVHEDDWEGKVRDEEVFCVCCGHAAPSDQWFTQEQLAHMEAVAFAQINGQITDAMKRDAQEWNRKQRRDSFLRISLSVSESTEPRELPVAAAEPLKLRIRCPQCACRYAVLGAGYFCPACGHNAAALMFSQSLEGIRKSVESVAGIRAAIADRDTAENMSRLIVESGLQLAVTAFQRYAEALYARFPDRDKPRRNAFQNLKEGSELWEAATGKTYESLLAQGEMASLTKAFQQRHLLAHTQGIIDEDYLRRSGDTSLRIGQRIVVREATVHDCLRLIEKMTAAMAAADYARERGEDDQQTGDA